VQVFAIVCVAEDQTVSNPINSDDISIRDTAIGQSILSCDVNSKVNIAGKITSKIAVGQRECFEVKTKLGSVVTTSDHRFFCNGKWKKLKHIQVGDILVAPYRYRNIIRDSITRHLHNSFKTGLLYPIVDYIRKQCDIKNITKKYIVMKTGLTQSDLNRECIRIDVLTQISKLLNDRFLKFLASGNFAATKIQSIISVGKKNVYDLTVENFNNFYCNNILVHNCEGQFDALRLHDHRLSNTVALCGTKLSDIQLSMIYRYCEEIVVILDTDENKAGQVAAKKVREKITYPGVKRDRFFIDQYATQIETLIFNENLDPDEYIRKYGIKQLKGLIRHKVEELRKRGH